LKYFAGVCIYYVQLYFGTANHEKATANQLQVAEDFLSI